MDRITRSLAEFASSLRFDQLDAAPTHAAPQRFIDTLGCALAAHDCEGARIGRRLASGQGAGKVAGHVLFSGEIVTAEAAGFIKTGVIRNLDFNDRYPGGHPSDCLGPLIAVAAAMRADGQ